MDTQESVDTREGANTQDGANIQDDTDTQERRKARRKGLRIRVSRGGTEAYFAAIWNVFSPGSPPHAPGVHHRLSGVRNNHARKRTAAFHSRLSVQVALGPHKRTAAYWKQRNVPFSVLLLFSINAFDNTALKVGNQVAPGLFKRAPPTWEK